MDYLAESLNVTTIDWISFSRQRLTLMHDQVINHVGKIKSFFTDSVLCFGKMSEHSEAIKRWENQLQEFQQFSSYAEQFRIDREPLEFE